MPVGSQAAQRLPPRHRLRLLGPRRGPPVRGRPRGLPRGRRRRADGLFPRRRRGGGRGRLQAGQGPRALAGRRGRGGLGRQEPPGRPRAEAGPEDRGCGLEEEAAVISSSPEFVRGLFEIRDSAGGAVPSGSSLREAAHESVMSHSQLEKATKRELIICLEELACC